MPGDPSLLPFELLERHAVHAGFERSIKLTPGKVQSERYVIGVNSQELAVEQWLDVARDLGAPERIFKAIADQLPRSTNVLIGFDSAPDTPVSYKLYLEFMNDMPAHNEGTDYQPFTLGVGYKWLVGTADQFRITKYQCHPWLSSRRLVQRVAGYYPTRKPGSERSHILGIVNRSIAEARGRHLIFLSVTEPDTKRGSFDVNLYPARLKTRDVLTQVDKIAAAFGCKESEYAVARSRIQDSRLGHISAGIGSDGRPAFSLYYDL